MKTKVCTKCYIEKPLNKFSKAKKGKFGVRGDCKECQKVYRIENKESIKELNKKWYKRNKKEKIKYSKEYYLKNKDKIDKKATEWKIKNIKKFKAYQKKYRIINRENIRNKEKFNRQNNPVIKLKSNLTHRLNQALRGHTKSLSTMFLIGCEIDYLMYYIQEQFTKGMFWDNYGDWHIDHKKPCSLFDLSIPDEQRRCFNYTNLQPLWARDNLRKSDTYENSNQQ